MDSNQEDKEGFGFLKQLLNNQTNAAVVSDYASEAFKIIKLNIVSDVGGMNYQNADLNSFNPKYTHQLFSDEEIIYGYRDLNINIYLSSCFLSPYIQSEYLEKNEDADDYMLIFDEWILGGYTTDYKYFTNQLKSEEYMQPLGKQIKQYECQGEKYIVFKSDIECENFEQFRKNVWNLFLFQIETASFDHDDSAWNLYSTYQVNKTGGFDFIGVISVTQFYLKLTVQRHRISQALILPKYQRQGHCARLLETVYHDVMNIDKVFQITVEDSSADFQFVRDMVQARLVIEGEYFEWWSQIKNKITSPTVLDSLSLKQWEIKSIQKRLKMPLEEVHTAYEILLLSKLDQNNPEVLQKYKQNYIQRIKKANIPGQRKVPFLCFEGKVEKLDVDVITEIQNKQMQVDQYFEKLHEYSVQHYKNVLQKLKL